MRWRTDTVYRFWKRVLDVAAASAGLIVLAPVLAALTLAVFVGLGRPVLFRQRRSGLDGREFHIIKFRTMRDAVTKSGEPLPDEMRLTRFGQWMRVWSLDELPQLWNVLTGVMTLVGPRPLLPAYVPRYTPEQRRRLLVKPGITGLAQVCGRNLLTWEEKFVLDTKYVDECSLALDIRVLAKTVGAVMSRSGISSLSSATMEPFVGHVPPGQVAPVNDGM